jgi:hypothetical protein
VNVSDPESVPAPGIRIAVVAWWLDELYIVVVSGLARLRVSEHAEYQNQGGEQHHIPLLPPHTPAPTEFHLRTSRLRSSEFRQKTTWPGDGM